MSILYWICSARLKVKLCQDLVHFNGVSGLGKWGIRLLRAMGLAKMRIARAEYCWGHLRNGEDEAVWQKVTREDLNSICAAVRNGELEGSLFIRRLCSAYLDHKRFLLYAEKRIYAEIWEKVRSINVIAHHFRPDGMVPEGEDVLFVSGACNWDTYIRAYAQKTGARTLSYPCWPQGILGDLRFAYFGVRRLPGLLLDTVYSLARSAVGSVKIAGDVQSLGPRVAMAHTGRKVIGTAGDRHDLFWWSGKDIAPERLLVYCVRSDLPLSCASAQALDELGIRYIEIRPQAIDLPDAPVWRPTWGFYWMGLKLARLICWSALGGVLSGEIRSFYYLRYASALLFDFSFWYDFFKTQNIGVNLDYAEFTTLGSIGSVMALQNLGGVSVSYQGSNLCDVTLAITPVSNALFAYSPAFARLWDSATLPVESMVYTGYIFDGAFCHLPERAHPVRRKLQQNGAKTIIAYFDENSSPSRDAIISNGDATSIYAGLLQKLLDEETLGLVCKPKKARNLFERIAGAGSLLQEAMATGRLLILKDLDTYPAEAGLIADLAVGELVGTTAALEAYLVGTPTILVDALGMKSHPYYSWGAGTVVFTDWTEALAAITRYDEDSAAVAGLGDWAPIVESLDPYRDGQAGRRMGEYMASLLRGIQDGKGGIQSMHWANERFARDWGPGAVESFVVRSSS